MFPVSNLPLIEIESNGFVKGEALRQGRHLDMTIVGHLIDNFTRLKKLLTHSGLSEAHKTEIGKKIDYGRTTPHLEYDTVINQIGFWCLEWGPARDAIFEVDALGEDAYERRQTVFL